MRRKYKDAGAPRYWQKAHLCFATVNIGLSL